MTTEVKSVPSISVSYARNGSSTRANALGMRPMQERAADQAASDRLLLEEIRALRAEVAALRADRATEPG